MSQVPYTPPSLNLSAFHCPFCNAFAKQVWDDAYIHRQGLEDVKNIKFCQCSHCGKFSVWDQESMIYPYSSLAPMPNQDLPDDIKYDFEEARKIISRSPRGASAIFRLCVQKLCSFLGEPGKDINSDIAALVKKGLNPKIQKSLDIVRVIGNEAVHPGAIDFKDNIEIALQLSRIINIIADIMITQPKLIESMYNALPEDKKKQIEKRDNTK